MVKFYIKKFLKGNALIKYKETLNVLSQEQHDILIGTLCFHGKGQEKYNMSNKMRRKSISKRLYFACLSTFSIFYFNDSMYSYDSGESQN